MKAAHLQEDTSQDVHGQGDLEGAEVQNTSHGGEETAKRKDKEEGPDAASDAKTLAEHIRQDASCWAGSEIHDAKDGSQVTSLEDAETKLVGQVGRQGIVQSQLQARSRWIRTQSRRLLHSLDAHIAAQFPSDAQHEDQKRLIYAAVPTCTNAGFRLKISRPEPALLTIFGQS